MNEKEKAKGAKEYLKQLKVLNVKIINKQKELSEMRQLSRSIGSFKYDTEKVQTSPGKDMLEKKAVQCVYLEREIDREIGKFVDLKHKIINEIHALNNSSYIEVLFKRYVEFKRFEEIAVETNYSYQYVRELHGAALKEFETTYKNLH